MKMKYPDDFVNKVIWGDCMEVMKDIPDNMIDTVLTDPPYEIGFMGKTWDTKNISFSVKLWEECLRVAKPGATLLCFGGTRTFHRLACAIDDAGWQIFDCIFWCFGSGFPKSTNIAKNIKKQLDKWKERIYTEYEDICKKLLNNVNFAEKTFQKNTTATGTLIPKNDFVVVNVIENLSEKTNQQLSAIIAELNLQEANPISEKSTITAQENVGRNTKHTKSSVVNAEEDLELQTVSETKYTAQNNAIIYQCEKIMDKVKAPEALKIGFGNLIFSKEIITNVSYVELIETLKHTILNQSKIFQNCDTKLQMELLTVIDVIITKSTMECLITKMENILGKKEKEWQGWGTHLKPAVEPIVCARKPIENNFAQNALKWGVSGLNITDARIKPEYHLTRNDLLDKIELCQSNHSNLIANNVEKRKLQDALTKKIKSLFSVAESVDMPILEKILGKMREDINKMDIGCSVEMLMESMNISLNISISGKKDMEKYQKAGKCIISIVKKMITELKICNACRLEVIGVLLTEIINGIQGQKQGRFPSNLILECICDEIESRKVKGRGMKRGTAKTCFNDTGQVFVGNLNTHRSDGYVDEDGTETVKIHTNPECPCYMLDKMSGERSFGNKKGGYSYQGKKYKVEGFIKNNSPQAPSNYGDIGGASRFFYVAKASKSERLLNGFNCAKIELWRNKDENMAQVVLLARAMLDLVVPNLSIEESGDNIMVKCQQDFISTIKTVINKITELGIWNLLMLQPTKDFIMDVFGKKMDGGNLAQFAEKSKELMTKIGILQERVGFATTDVKSATYELLLKIKENENWEQAYSNHPTHKPLKLMEYLCILTKTPTGGIILDPFAGSGTTGMACKKLKRDYILIEKEKEYCKIAEARIGVVQEPLF